MHTAGIPGSLLHHLLIVMPKLLNFVIEILAIFLATVSDEVITSAYEKVETMTEEQ